MPTPLFPLPPTEDEATTDPLAKATPPQASSALPQTTADLPRIPQTATEGARPLEEVLTEQGPARSPRELFNQTATAGAEPFKPVAQRLFEFASKMSAEPTMGERAKALGQGLQQITAPIGEAATNAAKTLGTQGALSTILPDLVAHPLANWILQKAQQANVDPVASISEKITDGATLDLYQALIAARRATPFSQIEEVINLPRPGTQPTPAGPIPLSSNVLQPSRDENLIRVIRYKGQTREQALQAALEIDAARQSFLFGGTTAASQFVLGALNVVKMVDPQLTDFLLTDEGQERLMGILGSEHFTARPRTPFGAELPLVGRASVNELAGLLGTFFDPGLGLAISHGTRSLAPALTGGTRSGATWLNRLGVDARLLPKHQIKALETEVRAAGGFFRGTDVVLPRALPTESVLRYQGAIKPLAEAVRQVAPGKTLNVVRENLVDEGAKFLASGYTVGGLALAHGLAATTRNALMGTNEAAGSAFTQDPLGAISQGFQTGLAFHGLTVAGAHAKRALSGQSRTVAEALHLAAPSRRLGGTADELVTTPPPEPTPVEGARAIRARADLGFAPLEVPASDITHPNPHIQRLARDAAAAGRPTSVGWLYARNRSGLHWLDPDSVHVIQRDGVTYGIRETSGGSEMIPLEGPEGLRALDLPADGDWAWKPDISSPIALRLEPASPTDPTSTTRLLFDPAGTQGRDVQQALLRRRLAGNPDPEDGPPALLFDILSDPPVVRERLEAYEDRLADLDRRLEYARQGVAQHRRNLTGAGDDAAPEFLSQLAAAQTALHEMELYHLQARRELDRARARFDAVGVPRTAPREAPHLDTIGETLRTRGERAAMRAEADRQRAWARSIAERDPASAAHAEQYAAGLERILEQDVSPIPSLDAAIQPPPLTPSSTPQAWRGSSVPPEYRRQRGYNAAARRRAQDPDPQLPGEFLTADGTTYAILPNGKTARSDAGGDHSFQTIYVVPEVAAQLQAADATLPEHQLIVTRHDTVVFRRREGRTRLQFLDEAGVFDIRREPSEGYVPVELRNFGRELHIGTPIVRLTSRAGTYGPHRGALTLPEEGSAELAYLEHLNATRGTPQEAPEVRRVEPESSAPVPTLQGGPTLRKGAQRIEAKKAAKLAKGADEAGPASITGEYNGSTLTFLRQPDGTYLPEGGKGNPLPLETLIQLIASGTLKVQAEAAQKAPTLAPAPAPAPTSKVEGAIAPFDDESNLTPEPPRGPRLTRLQILGRVLSAQGYDPALAEGLLTRRVAPEDAVMEVMKTRTPIFNQPWSDSPERIMDRYKNEFAGDPHRVLVATTRGGQPDHNEIALRILAQSVIELRATLRGDNDKLAHGALRASNKPAAIRARIEALEEDLEALHADYLDIARGSRARHQGALERAYADETYSPEDLAARATEIRQSAKENEEELHEVFADEEATILAEIKALQQALGRPIPLDLVTVARETLFNPARRTGVEEFLSTLGEAPALPARPTVPPTYSRLERAIVSQLRAGSSYKASSVVNILRKAPEGLSMEEVRDTGLGDWLARKGDEKVRAEDVAEFFEGARIEYEVSVHTNEPFVAPTPRVQRLIARMEREQDRDSAGRAGEIGHRYLELINRAQGKPPGYRERPLEYSPTGSMNYARLWSPGTNHKEWLFRAPETERFPATEPFELGEWTALPRDPDFPEVLEVFSAPVTLPNGDRGWGMIKKWADDPTRVEGGKVTVALGDPSTDYFVSGIVDTIQEAKAWAVIQQVRGFRPKRASGLYGQWHDIPHLKSHYNWPEPRVALHLRTVEQDVPGVGRVLLIDEYQPLTDWLTGPNPPPLVEALHALGLKHILRHAAEEGFDAVGWTPAEVQQERYANIPARMLALVQGINPDGTEPSIWIQHVNHGFKVIHLQPGETSAKYIGAELASQLEAAPEGELDGKSARILDPPTPEGFKLRLPWADAIYGPEGRPKPSLIAGLLEQIGKRAGVRVASSEEGRPHLLPLNDAIRAEALEKGFPQAMPGQTAQTSPALPLEAFLHSPPEALFPGDTPAARRMREILIDARVNAETNPEFRSLVDHLLTESNRVGMDTVTQLLGHFSRNYRLGAYTPESVTGLRAMIDQVLRAETTDTALPIDLTETDKEILTRFLAELDPELFKVVSLEVTAEDSPLVGSFRATPDARGRLLHGLIKLFADFSQRPAIEPRTAIHEVFHAIVEQLPASARDEIFALYETERAEAVATGPAGLADYLAHLQRIQIGIADPAEITKFLRRHPHFKSYFQQDSDGNYYGIASPYYRYINWVEFATENFTDRAIRHYDAKGKRSRAADDLTPEAFTRGATRTRGVVAWFKRLWARLVDWWKWHHSEEAFDRLYRNFGRGWGSDKERILRRGEEPETAGRGTQTYYETDFLEAAPHVRTAGFHDVWLDPRLLALIPEEPLPPPRDPRLSGPIPENNHQGRPIIRVNADGSAEVINGIEFIRRAVGSGVPRLGVEIRYHGNSEKLPAALSKLAPSTVAAHASAVPQDTPVVFQLPKRRGKSPTPRTNKTQLELLTEALDRVGRKGMSRDHWTLLSDAQRMRHYEGRLGAIVTEHTKDGKTRWEEAWEHLRRLSIQFEADGYTVSRPLYMKGWRVGPALRQEISAIWRAYDRKLARDVNADRALRGLTSDLLKGLPNEAPAIDPLLSRAGLTRLSPEQIVAAWETLEAKGVAHDYSDEELATLMGLSSAASIERVVAASFDEVFGGGTETTPAEQAAMDALQEFITQRYQRLRGEARSASGLVDESAARLGVAERLRALTPLDPKWTDHWTSLVNAPLQTLRIGARDVGTLLGRLQRPAIKLGMQSLSGNSAKEFFKQAASGETELNPFFIVLGTGEPDTPGALSSLAYINQLQERIAPLLGAVASDKTRNLLHDLTGAIQGRIPLMQQKAYLVPIDEKLAAALNLGSQREISLDKLAHAYNTITHELMTRSAAAKVRTLTTLHASKVAAAEIFLRRVRNAIDPHTITLPAEIANGDVFTALRWFQANDWWEDLARPAVERVLEIPEFRQTRDLLRALDHVMKEIVTVQNQIRTWTKLGDALEGRMSATQIAEEKIPYDPALSPDIQMQMIFAPEILDIFTPWSDMGALSPELRNQFLSSLEDRMVGKDPGTLNILELWRIMFPAAIRTIFIEEPVARARQKLHEADEGTQRYFNQWAMAMVGHADRLGSAIRSEQTSQLRAIVRGLGLDSEAGVRLMQDTYGARYAETINKPANVFGNVASMMFMSSVGPATIALQNFNETIRIPMQAMVTGGARGVGSIPHMGTGALQALADSYPRTIGRGATFVRSLAGRNHLRPGLPSMSMSHLMAADVTSADEPLNGLMDMITRVNGDRKDRKDRATRRLFKIQYFLLNMLDRAQRGATWESKYVETLQGLWGAVEIVGPPGAHYLRDRRGLNPKFIGGPYKTEQEAIRAGIEWGQRNARWFAKFQSDLLFSDYSRLGQSPSTRGSFGPLWMHLKRFAIDNWGKLLNEIGGASQNATAAELNGALSERHDQRGLPTRNLRYQGGLPVLRRHFQGRPNFYPGGPGQSPLMRLTLGLGPKPYEVPRGAGQTQAIERHIQGWTRTLDGELTSLLGQALTPYEVALLRQAPTLSDWPEHFRAAVFEGFRGLGPTGRSALEAEQIRALRRSLLSTSLSLAGILGTGSLMASLLGLQFFVSRNLPWMAFLTPMASWLESLIQLPALGVDYLTLPEDDPRESWMKQKVDKMVDTASLALLPGASLVRARRRERAEQLATLRYQRMRASGGRLTPHERQLFEEERKKMTGLRGAVQAPLDLIMALTQDGPEIPGLGRPIPGARLALPPEVIAKENAARGVEILPGVPYRSRAVVEDVKKRTRQKPK